MRSTRFLKILAGVVFLALPLTAHAATPTIAPAELHPGQAAIVHTVFEGATIDTFSARIVGVLRGGRSEGTTILARATNDRVVKSGVAQGMSGSPVYVEGRLVGALSSGWAFSREPVFGITPIAEMLETLVAATDSSSESAGPSGVQGSGGTRARFREWRWDDGDRENDADPDDDVTGRDDDAPLALRLPLATSGLAPALLPWAEHELGRHGLKVTPGGSNTRAEAGMPRATLVPGSAAAVDVLRGDLMLSAIGTVTWVEGDRVLLFGHPFFQAGDVHLPLATASIITILASDNLSFKIGVRNQEVGAILQDRRAAISGRIGAVARMLPITITLDDARRGLRTFRFESIEDRALAPILLGLAASNSLLEHGGLAGNQTLRWSMTLNRPGAAPLVLSDVVASDAPVQEIATQMGAPLRFLLANPFERLRLDSISVRIDARPGRSSWTVRAARLRQARVRAGGRVSVDVDLARWRGETTTRTLEIMVPEELPAGRYTVWLGGGAELSRYEATRLPGRFRVVSLDDAWARLGRMRSGARLHAGLLARAPEVHAEGRDYPELPLSALSLMASDLVASDRTRRGDLAILDEVMVAVDGVVRGELLLNIQVDDRAGSAPP